MTPASRIETLDGIRALACILVFLGHAGWERIFPFIPGAEELGVRLFFSLSGFLMAYLYIVPEKQTRGKSCGKFWVNYAIRRVTRIYPAFICVLLIYWLANRLHFTFMPPDTLQGVLDHVALMRHSYIFWTIAIEMKFYLLFPFIVSALFLISRDPRFHIVALVIFWLAAALPDHLRIKVLLITHLSYFMAGIMAGYISRFKPVAAPFYAINALFIVCLLLLAIAAVHTLFINIFGFKPDVYRHGFIFSLLTGITVYTAAHAQGWVRWMLAHPILRFIGMISFSIYLTHFLIMRMTKKLLVFPPAAEFLLAAIFTILISWMLYRFVEKPGQALGKNLANRL
jgi:peptidoglycan/LPS O-acetylase OafA/YrhL